MQVANGYLWFYQGGFKRCSLSGGTIGAPENVPGAVTADFAVSQEMPDDAVIAGAVPELRYSLRYDFNGDNRFDANEDVTDHLLQFDYEVGRADTDIIRQRFGGSRCRWQADNSNGEYYVQRNRPGGVIQLRASYITGDGAVHSGTLWAGYCEQVTSELSADPPKVAEVIGEGTLERWDRQALPARLPAATAGALTRTDTAIQAIYDNQPPGWAAAGGVLPLMAPNDFQRGGATAFEVQVVTSRLVRLVSARTGVNPAKAVKEIAKTETGWIHTDKGGGIIVEGRGYRRTAANRTTRLPTINENEALAQATPYKLKPIYSDKTICNTIQATPAYLYGADTPPINFTDTDGGPLLLGAGGRQSVALAAGASFTSIFEVSPERIERGWFVNSWTAPATGTDFDETTDRAGTTAVDTPGVNTAIVAADSSATQVAVTFTNNGSEARWIHLRQIRGSAIHDGARNQLNAFNQPSRTKWGLRDWQWGGELLAPGPANTRIAQSIVNQHGEPLLGLELTFDALASVPNLELAVSADDGGYVLVIAPSFSIDRATGFWIERVGGTINPTLGLFDFSLLLTQAYPLG